MTEQDISYENEIWKPIVGWEELYDVSNKGNIRSKDRICGHRFKTRVSKGRVLKGLLGDTGYYRVNLLNKSLSVRKTKYIHRLVAEAFLLNPDNLPQVNHIDLNKINNSLENLEWISCKDNIIHAKKLGNNNEGQKHYRTFLKDRDILDIRLKHKSGYSIKEISIIYGVNYNVIQKIIYKINWRHVK